MREYLRQNPGYEFFDLLKWHQAIKFNGSHTGHFKIVSHLFPRLVSDILGHPFTWVLFYCPYLGLDFSFLNKCVCVCAGILSPASWTHLHHSLTTPIPLSYSLWPEQKNSSNHTFLEIAISCFPPSNLELPRKWMELKGYHLPIIFSQFWI